MRAIPIAIAVVGLVGLAACEVEQTEEGDVPEVDVNATGGQLPEYDVETQDVDVGTEQREVTVPTIETEEPGQ